MEGLFSNLYSGINRVNNPDGTTTIHCRKCGRGIIRMVRPPVRTVTECAVCLLIKEGMSIKEAEKHVLAQYTTMDPTKPPMPIIEDDPLHVLYPEEAVEAKKNPLGLGVVGTAKAVIRALGWIKDERPEIAPVSKRTAKRVRSGGLFQRDEEPKSE